MNDFCEKYFGLANKRAVVTGAGRGIGRAIAEALAAVGAEVLIHYHTSKEKAAQVVSGIDGRVEFTLDTGATIEGIVVDEAGKPLSIRSVVAVDSRGREHDATESRVDGRFVLRTLPRDRRLDLLVLSDRINLRRDKSFYHAKLRGVQPGRRDVRIVAKRLELGVVELEVVDASTEKPVAQYEVRCSSQPLWRRSPRAARWLRKRRRRGPSVKIESRR